MCHTQHWTPPSYQTLFREQVSIQIKRSDPIPTTYSVNRRGIISEVDLIILKMKESAGIISQAKFVALVI